MKKKIITCHGYNSNPDSKNPEDRPDSQQREFAMALHEHQTEPFNWYSSIQGNFKCMFNAWCAGYPTTYHHAYQELALKAADAFLYKYAGQDKLNVFAHSLGSRVVLAAIDKAPEKFERVCFINAAERVSVALPILQRATNIKILNCCVKEDDVLDKAAGYMSPGRGKERILGQDGILFINPEFKTENFTQIRLDIPSFQDRYHEKYGWTLKGDNPDSYGDHHYSYKWQGNWPLYNAFFDDNL